MQTDLVRFDLRIGLEDADPARTAVSPISGTDEQAAQGSPDATATPTVPAAAPAAALVPQPRVLPFTGGQPLLLVGWGALLVFAGRVLVQAARQRRA